MSILFHVGLQKWPLGNTDQNLLYFLTTNDEWNQRSLIVQIHNTKSSMVIDLPLILWKTYFPSTFSMRACRPRVWGWLWPWRRSTSCLRALSSILRAATSFSSRQLSLSAMLIVSGSPARADSFIESSTDSSQASRLPRAWSTFTTYTVEKQRG